MSSTWSPWKCMSEVRYVIREWKSAYNPLEVKRRVLQQKWWNEATGEIE